VEKRPEPFVSLIGEKLSAITFVLDYWQLQFDGPSISAFTRLEVSAGGLVLRDGEDQFQNVICGQIGKIVLQVTLVQPEAFTVIFEDKSSISVSLKWQHYRGPEAMTFHGLDPSELIVI
jgi:hypothetical protein